MQGFTQADGAGPGRPLAGLLAGLALAVLGGWLVASAHAAVPPTFAAPAAITGPYPTGPFSYLNGIVGADLFYNSGLYGASTVIGNVEAGYIWDGHEVFDRSGLGLANAVAGKVAGTGVAGEDDFHATMVGHVLGGYLALSSGTAPIAKYVGRGLAPVAKLWSGAIATTYSGSSFGLFTTTPASTIPVYRQFFQGISGTACDVINSSYGGQDPAALTPQSIAIDALAVQNPRVTFVASAGNDDVDPVGAPGSVYNGITVGSVGGADGLTPSAFSSRGAVDFYDPATDTLVTGVRAAVDIAAPGENHYLAAYLGPTGSYGPFPEYALDPSPDDYYWFNQNGTSFASPTVAGGVALMKDAAKAWWLGMPETALDSRVVKAVLKATSGRTTGWNNGQATVGGVLRTTQALDWTTGAGALDLTSAGLAYVNGATVDLSGTAGGTIGDVGWDFGAVGVGGQTDYTFSAPLAGRTEFQVSLDWFTHGAFDAVTDTGTRSAFANLDLQVWRVIDGSFATLVAESSSLYNNAEFLRFTLAPGGLYGLRVRLPGMIYDLGETAVTAETYGLAWRAVVVPEPAAGMIAVVGITLAVAAVRRPRRRAAAADLG
jgi:hypothetical protein